MTYQNRSFRCKHGFEREVVPCPTCDEPRAYKAAYYVPSYGKHTVVNKRGKGRAREHRASGYVVGRARRAGT